MEMHQIRYFLAVAETLNFTRAAEACCVAQPSLSRAVRNLEEELGGALFRRERGHSHLTELGRTMLPLLRQSYECALAAKAQAESYGSAEFAPFRLGLTLTIDLDVIAPILAELDRAYQGLTLHLMRGPGEAVLEALKQGEVELAIVAEDLVQWERFDRWGLYEEDFVVVPPTDSDATGPSALAERSLIMRPYCESSAALLAMLEAQQITPVPGHVVENDNDALVIAKNGLGLALFPRSAVGDDSGVPLPHFHFTRTLYVYAVAGRQRSPAAAALLSLLRAANWPHAIAGTA